MLNTLNYETKNNNFVYYKSLIVVSLILSILWISFIPTVPFSDFDYYYKLAIQISKGGPWGDTYTSVGYSIILGGIFKIFGTSLLVAKIFNLLLTLSSNILFYLILKKLKMRQLHKKIIFTLFVLFPNNIMYNSVLCTEILFTTLLLLITYVYFTDIKYKYVILGILTGINTMVKPFFMAFALLIFIVEVLKEKKFIKPLKSCLIIMIIGNLIISPWIIRNTKLNKQFTYVSNNGGIVLYINNNSQNKNGRWMDVYKVNNSIANTKEYKTASMTKKNEMLKKGAKDWIKSHPKDFFTLGLKRLFNTYMVADDILYTVHGTSLPIIKMIVPLNIVRVFVFLPAIMYIAIYSIFILYKIKIKESDKLNKFDLYTTILFYMFTCVYFVTEGQGRYAFPEIFIFIYFFVKAIFKLKELKK